MSKLNGSPPSLARDFAQQLPDEERTILALQLLDSVGESESAVERAWRDEVRRCIADIDSSRAKLLPWDEAKRRIFAPKEDDLRMPNRVVHAIPRPM